MRHGQRIIRADLQQQITVGELGLQPVDAEGRQRLQPARRPGGVHRGNQPGPEAERDGQPGRHLGELALGVGQRRFSRGEVCGVVAEEPQQRLDPGARRPRQQIQRDKNAVGLRRRRDARLAGAVKGDNPAAVDALRAPAGADFPAALGVRPGELGAGRGQRPEARGGAAEEQSAPRQFPRGAGPVAARGGSRRLLVPGHHLEVDDGAELVALPAAGGLAVGHAGAFVFDVVLVGAAEVLRHGGEFEASAARQRQRERHLSAGGDGAARPISMRWLAPGSPVRRRPG